MVSLRNLSSFGSLALAPATRDLGGAVVARSQQRRRGDLGSPRDLPLVSLAKLGRLPGAVVGDANEIGDGERLRARLGIDAERGEIVRRQ